MKPQENIVSAKPDVENQTIFNNFYFENVLACKPILILKNVNCRDNGDALLPGCYCRGFERFWRAFFSYFLKNILCFPVVIDYSSFSICGWMRIYYGWLMGLDAAIILGFRLCGWILRFLWVVDGFGCFKLKQTCLFS